MHTEYLDDDILMVRGDSFESVATAFFDGEDALLVDSLADPAEARQLRAMLQAANKQVRRIVLTHYMGDHTAGLAVFPEAELIAHRNFSYTAHMGLTRSPEARAGFVAPHMVFDTALAIQHGRHRLDLFHNPGKTLCSIGISASPADLLFTADNVLGRIASSSTPDLLRDGIDRLRQAPGQRLVQGHQGVFPRESLDWASHYLDALEARVRGIRLESGPEAPLRIAGIDIVDCLQAGLIPTPFERIWHGHNLRLVNDRGLFDAPLRYGHPAAPPSGSGLTGPVRRLGTAPAHQTHAGGQSA